MFQNYKQKHCYLIAEIGGNFTTIEQGRKLVDAAAECGVDAVKLQTYRAETIASKEALFEMENTGIVSQFELFEQYQIDESLHREVFEYAGSKGLDWFSTPSHETDVEMLERLGVGCHKIGSDDAVNLPFLRYVAGIGKPIILSTGMCTLDEVKESVDAILAAGCTQLILLHAITSYPTHREQVNLQAMVTLMDTFPNLDVGYSDHTLDPTASLCAAAMGARVIERHFTLDKAADGPDHMLSADPREMHWLVDQVRAFEIMRGDGIKRPTEGEWTSIRNNRKSLVLAQSVEADDILTREHLAIKRPGWGISPGQIDNVLGRSVRTRLSADKVLTWEDVSD